MRTDFPISNLLVVLLLLFSGSVCAQAPYPDTEAAHRAENSLVEKRQDTARVQLLLDLSKWYTGNPEGSSPKKPLLYARQALALSGKLNYLQGTADSYFQLSVVSQNLKNYQLGVFYAMQAVKSYHQLKQPDQIGESWVMVWSNHSINQLPYAKRIIYLDSAAVAFEKSNNKGRQADCLKEAADLYQVTGDGSKALSSLKKALVLYQKAGSTRLYGAYDLMGAIYMMLGDYQNGIKYGLVAARSAEKFGDAKTYLCTIYNRIGLANIEINQREKAQEYLMKSLNVAIKYNDFGSIKTLIYNLSDNFIGLGDLNGGLAFINRMRKKYPALNSMRKPVTESILVNIYVKLGQYEKAKAFALIVERKLDNTTFDDSSFLNAIYRSLIELYIETGNNTKAEKYTSLYAGISQKRNSASVYENYYLWKFKTDSACGRYVQAIADFQKFKNLQDKLFNETKSQQIGRLNILYETEKKDKNIQLLRKQAGWQEKSLRQANLIRNFTLGILLLLLIILFMMYKGYRLKQKTNKALEQQQEEINRKNKSLQHMVTEKEWLLKEIHHRVKNNLHMVVGLLASQAEFLKGKEAFQAISDSQNRIQAMSLIHQKLYQTENFSIISMPSYILELTEYLKDSFSLDNSIRFHLDIDAVEFPLSHSIPLGLLLNEAVTNAIKYAFPAGRQGILSISLKETAEQHYILSITDNGIGLADDFDPYNQPSLGIRLMQGLSEDIHGDFTINGKNGTTITLAFMIGDTAAAGL